MTDPITPALSNDEPRFPDARLLHVNYDRKRDTLTVSVKEPGPALSIDMGDGMWMQIIPATNDVVGFEIEDFRRIFLRRNPAIAEAWHAGFGRGILGFRRTRTPDRFHDQVIRFLRHAFAHRAQQFSFPA